MRCYPFGGKPVSVDFLDLLPDTDSKFIVNYIKRKARVLIRKLGPIDSLVVPVKLVINYGSDSEALSTATSIFYDEPSDPIALQLKDIREEKRGD